MGDFFHGWRRKVGCVTLVMACMVTGLWARSVRTFDILNCPLGQEYAVAVASWKQAFAIRCGWDTEDHWGEFVWNTDDQDIFGHTDSTFYLFDPPIPDGSGDFVPWLLRSRGSGIGVSPLDERPYRRMLFMIVPYWSIVIPLILLSAYLILWKPRKRTGPDHA